MKIDVIDGARIRTEATVVFPWIFKIPAILISIALIKYIFSL